MQYENNTELHPSTIYRILKRNNVRYTSEYPRTRKKWKKRLYSRTIIDDATRWVFAWSYDTANANNTVDFLNKALSRAPFLVQKIRTDQGREFVDGKENTI